MHTVLLVEDDDELRTTLDAGLRQAGFRTIVCRDGREALDRLDDGRPSLVVSDIVMADQDGIGELLEIRRRSPSLPVVMMSGTPEYLVMAEKLGASSTLLKPFRLQELLQAISRHLAL